MLTLPGIPFFATSCGVRTSTRNGASIVAKSLGCYRSAHSLRAAGQAGVRVEAHQSAIEVAGHVVETDATEPERAFPLASRIRDDHDRPIAPQDRAGPRRVLAAEPDVDASFQMGRGEVRWFAGVDDLWRPLAAARARARLRAA